MSHRTRHGHSCTAKAERRRIKSDVFLYTALGISLWLCLLAYLSPTLTDSTWLGRKLLTSGKCSSFPQWQKPGGVPIFHFAGILYLFLGISIACDEFFVGSLQAISTKLGLSQDVAGATFMAAGSSAPELFSSLVALTNDEAANDIGIGTIVGSAIFNILIIIGVTAIFSGRTLYLDYRPLARDAIFYAASIIGVILFFHDGKIHWWEGLISVLLYGVYVVAMKYNKQLLKRFPSKGHQHRSMKIGPNQDIDEQLSPTEAESNSVVDEEAGTETNGAQVHKPPRDEESSPSPEPSQRGDDIPLTAPPQGAAEEECDALYLGIIPKPVGNKFTWTLSVPWYLAFGISIPRCETERWKNWYLMTFLSSVLWIGLISWFMVEWAADMGCILGIPSAIMGVTVLAAGTSIPDALSSIVVARNGFGDMAVANAVGSNVFDIWLGLGIPWLCVIPFKNDGKDNGAYIEVDNGEMLPNVLILFGVLMFYLASVAIAGRRLFPKEGYIFIGLYVIYAVYNIVAVWQLDVYNIEDDD